MRLKVAICALYVFVFASIGFFASAANAHLDPNLPKGCSIEERCDYFARKTHHFFKNDWRAHAAQRIASCESGFWERAGYPHHAYWGSFQFGSWARSNFGWSLKLWRQIRSAKRLLVATNWNWWGQFPYCSRYV